MNCTAWEERIALYAGGDLEPAGMAEVAEHLSNCAACQTFARGLRDSMELVRSAHGEPIAVGHYTAVRTAVIARLAQQRRPWWRRGWAYGLAACAALLFFVLAIHHSEKPGVPAPGVSPAPQVAETAPPDSPPRPVASPAPVRRPRPRRLIASADLPQVASPAASPLVVKLMTNDPDVVIYWITDKKEEDK